MEFRSRLVWKPAAKIGTIRRENLTKSNSFSSFLRFIVDSEEFVPSTVYTHKHCELVIYVRYSVSSAIMVAEF